MRYGATVAAAKAGASPEFLVQKREATAAKDPMHHAILRVSDIRASVAAAKAAGATVEREMTVKSAAVRSRLPCWSILKATPSS